MGEQLITPQEAATDELKLHKGRGSPLTHGQLDVLVAMSRLNKTQAEIAQAISCDQATVSRYLKLLNPTGAYADAYLRANQGLLAEKFVEGKARGSDILDLLERFETIPARKEQERGGITVIVGGDAQVQINAFAPSEKG